MSVGNDVVDLDDAESRLESLHPRWAGRVFSATERATLAKSDTPRRLHWALWAAKEAAYKALKRHEPAAVFSPREFEVALGPLPATGAATGRVVHRGRVLALELQLQPSWVHAVAATEDEAALLSRVDGARHEPSLAARRLAAAHIAPALGLHTAEIRIEGRPPVARHGDRAIAVSLSHHGRFVAFACASPRERPAPVAPAPASPPGYATWRSRPVFTS